jgi:hypothetical protein
VTAGSGVLSIDAVRWCRDAGVAVAVLDGDDALAHLAGMELPASHPNTVDEIGGEM